MFGDPKQKQVIDRTMLCVLVVIEMHKTQHTEPKNAKAVLQAHHIPPNLRLGLWFLQP